MSKEYRAKVFKSGNSLALRLPKALGLIEGAEMVLRQDAGGLTIQLADAPRPLIDLTGITGSAPWLEPLPREEFDDPTRAWDVGTKR